MAPSVTFELVPPYTSLKFMLPLGEVVVDKDGVHTPEGVDADDPRVVTELDTQNHAVRRKGSRS